MIKTVMQMVSWNRYEVQLELLFGADFRENCRRKR